MNTRGIVRHSLKLVFLTAGSRVLGLIREIVRAAYLGTTAFSDAFTIAFLLPNLMRKLFAEGSIAVAFVPTFKGYLIEDNREKIRLFLSSFLTVLTFLVVTAVTLGILFTGPLIHTFYADLTPDIQQETAFLTRIMFPYLAFISMAAFFQGILNSVNIFGPAGAVPMVFNGCIIASTVLLSPYMDNPARAMTVGVIVGGSLQALLQLPYVIRTGFRFCFRPLAAAFRDPGVRKIFLLVGPTVIGMAAYEVNVLASSVIASTAGTGVVSSLQFSNRLLELLLGIFAVSIGTVVLTELSENAKRNEWDKFTGHLLFSINLIALVTIPATLIALMNGREIITLVFKARAFGDDSVTLTTAIFLCHIAGLYFIAANRVLAPAFYAQEDTKSPTWAGMWSFGANIALCLALVGPLKGQGIALAATLAALINTTFLVLPLIRKKRDAFGPMTGRAALYAFRILLISGAIAAPLYFLKPYLYGLFAASGWRIVALGIPLTLVSIIFFALFFAALFLMKDTQALWLAGKLKKKFMGGNGKE